MSHPYDPIAYTYEADHHCPDCAEERFGRSGRGFIAEDAEDSEGNPVGAVSPWDCWWSGGDGCETLSCGDCGDEIDVAHNDPHGEDCPDFEAPDDYVEAATVAYLECAVWSSSDFPTDATEEEREGDPTNLDDLGYGIDDIATVGQGGYGEMAVAVEEFITANWQDVKALDPASVGHDFWLTRNRHGVGFWDRGLGEVGTRLTDAAHVYGESTLYIGDDGQLYVA